MTDNSLVSCKRSRSVRVIGAAILSLWVTTPILADTPTKEVYDKCHSADSVPSHFAESTDVVAAIFQGNTDNETMGYYKITSVWKGNKKEGDEFAFRLPCYERDPLMQPGKMYLFFMKQIPSTSAYEASSCFPVRILGEGQVHPNSAFLIKILDKERDKLNRR